MKPTKVLLFFNNMRGLKVLNFLRKKKDINIYGQEEKNKQGDGGREIYGLKN